jgi:hypothetical protein
MRSVTEDLLDLAPLGKFRRLQDSPSENPTEPSNPPRGRHADTVAFKSTGASNRFLMKKYIKVVYPIGSMYAIYDNIYHQYTPNVSIYIYHTWILWVLYHGVISHQFRILKKTLENECSSNISMPGKTSPEKR